MRLAGLIVTSLVVAGCTRDPAEKLCPEIQEGDLVLTEIAGPQMGQESLVEWIELYNASGRTIDLYGVKVRFRRVDGSGETSVLVRRELPAAAGSYTVLGKDDDDDNLEIYLDYGFSTDFKTSWLASAAVDVEACGTRIDRVRYDSLPRTGTYSLGVTPPTEEANDLPANWCTDATMNAGIAPGSPQLTNVACP